MKTKYCIFIFAINLSYAQNNEISISDLITVGYERKVTDKSSFGIRLGTGLIEDKENYDITRLYTKIYGRYYFLRNQNFNKFYGQYSFVYRQIENLPFPAGSNQYHYIGKYNEGGPAIGLGYKFLIKDKFVIDLYADIG